MDIFLHCILIGLSVTTIAVCVLVFRAVGDTSQQIVDVAGAVASLRERVASLEIPSAATVQVGDGAMDASVLDSVKKYDKHFSVIASTLSSFQASSDSGLKRVDQDMSRIESLVTGMRDYLAESNQQISRLQEGYDYSVLKRIVRPVILTANALEGIKQRLGNAPEAQEIHTLWLDLLDALEHNGIERLNIKKGIDFSDIRKVAEATSVKETTDDAKNAGKVAEVVRPGYCYVYNGDKRRLVFPAQVKLYEKIEG